MVNFATILLYIQYTLSVIAIVVGVIHLIRKSDVLGVRIAGVISISLGIFFIYRSHDLFPGINSEASTAIPILSGAKLMGYMIWSYAISLIPIISLRPSWFNFKKISRAAHPIIFSAFALFINDVFVDKHTQLYSISDVMANLYTPDVAMRLIIFGESVLLAVTYLFWPFGMLRKLAGRKPTRFLFLFQACMFLALMLHIFSYQNVYWIHAYRLALILITLTTAIGFFWRDTFITVRILPERSVPEPDNLDEYQHLNLDIAQKQLRLSRANRMIDLIKSEHLIRDPHFCLTDLSEKMGIEPSVTSDIIRLLGYTGFKEMLGSMRCDEFKFIAHQKVLNHEPIRVDELIAEVGCTSPSAFHRAFKSLSGYSIEKFVEKLQTQTQA